MKLRSMLTGVAVAGLASSMAALPAFADYHCGGSYTVQPGDTLSAIAARCNSSVTELIRANGQIADPSEISVGWRLTIPEAGSTYGYADDAAGYSSQDEYNPLTPYHDQSGYVSDYDVPPFDGLNGMYQAQPGDTLAGIATQLGLSLAGLISANSGVSPYGLQVGQSIQLPYGYYAPDRYGRYGYYAPDAYRRYGYYRRDGYGSDRAERSDRYHRDRRHHDRYGSNDSHRDRDWHDRRHHRHDADRRHDRRDDRIGQSRKKDHRRHRDDDQAYNYQWKQGDRSDHSK